MVFYCEGVWGKHGMLGVRLDGERELITMIQEHAFRKIEYHLHQFCVERDLKPILLNLITASNRGYSAGTYLAKGNFVHAPVESLEERIRFGHEEFVWPFTSESQAANFLALVRAYFRLRGVRAEILGIEGFASRR